MSSNNTTGQNVGYLVGAVVGYVVGDYYDAALLTSAMLGASIGGAVGGAIDPPKGPQLVGPRLNDLSVQGAAYGTSIPRVYGSVAMMGNIFWIENNQLKEVSKTEKSGGKGGGGKSSNTTYAYYATFGLGLCEGPIAGIRRIWISGKLFYDAGSSDVGTIFASNQVASGFTVHYGSDTQDADPRMQATLGVANTPAYRGLAYIVFEDLPMEDYGNSLMGAQIKVEVVSVANFTHLNKVKEATYYQPHSSTSFSGQPVYVGLDKCTVAVPQWDSYYPATSSMVFYDLYPDGSIVQDTAISCPGTGVPPNQQSSTGKWLYDATQVFSHFVFEGPHGQIAEADGLWVGLCNTTYTGLYASRGSPSTQISIPLGAGDEAITTDGKYIWVVGAVSRKFDSSFNLITTGAGSPGGILRIWWDADSNALYGVKKNTSFVTIFKWPADLSSCTDISGLLPITGTLYYQVSLYVKNNIVIVAFGGNSASYKKLSVNYFSLNSASNTTVSLGSIVAEEAEKSGILTLTDIDTSTLTDAVRGYRISQVAALRSGIEPLQGAWPFDVFQSGYKIKFARRGVGSSVATIDSAFLDAREAGSAPGVVITKSREMDTQLPWRVEINHLDFSREYDINTQYAERLNTSSININKIEMSIVMTADDAAQKAEILLYMYWLERHDISFKLPPQYGYLEPADIITVTTPNGSLSLRLTNIQYNPSGVIECQAKFNSPAVYSSSAIGAPNYSTFATTIPFPGPVIYELMDIPCTLPATNTSGFEVAMCAANGEWHGGALWKSVDNEQSWYLSNAIASTGMIGFATNVIGAPPTFCLIDKANVIKAKFYDGALSSVTELQLLNGANHFAYGVDGRWEIIAAQTCALQADGSYFIYDLLRGRFGSEAAASTHAANDKIILLNDSQVQFVASNTASIGAALSYRGITDSADVLTATSRLFTYRGVNLEPLSPVYLAGSITPGTNDWSMNWKRRTRADGDWRDLVDAALSETAETYDVEICTDSGYATVKRTFAGLTSAACTYTSAQQVADFGSNQTQLYVRVYQNSSVVGRGYPLSRPLPFTDETIILMHCEGTPGESVFRDEMGKSIGVGGVVTTADDVAPAFGKTAAKFAGSGYLTWPAGLPSLNDFTLQWRHYGNLSQCIWSVDGNTYLYNNTLWLNGTYMSGISWSNGSSTWCDVVITRSGSALRILKDGIVCFAATYAPAVNFSTLYWGIYKPNMNLYMTARIDEVRLSSRCLYPANFTPATSELTIDQGVY